MWVKNAPPKAEPFRLAMIHSPVALPRSRNWASRAFTHIANNLMYDHACQVALQVIELR